MLQNPPFERLSDRPPVILVGMHRSGTSLLCRLLDQLGIHLGHDQEPINAESRHFLRLNKRMLHAAGAEWNDPAPFIAALQNPAFVQEWSAHTRMHTFAGVSGVGYWGIRQWIALRRGGALPVWGWKDPRTSLTLGIWLDALPEAQIVRILRNGIDVAVSLHRRQLAQQQRWRVHPDHRDPHGLDPRFCFALWEQYEQHLQAFRDYPRYTEIRYEDLLHDPVSTLRSVLAATGVNIDEARIVAAAQMVKPPRADNWAGYAGLIPEFMASPVMCSLGYVDLRSSSQGLF
jgi:hypothetical protein